MSRFGQTVEKARADNLIDDRNAMVFSNAKALPNGEHGLCLLCVNGSTLRIFDTDFSQNVGGLLYEIELNRIRNVKSSSFVLRRSLIFEYEGKDFYLADFGDAKRFLEVILEESKKG